MRRNIWQDIKALPWQPGGSALVFLALALAVALVYAPTLMHVPRGDQIMYFAEVAPKQSLWDLTIGSLDLNRHRQFNPGDEILFRPLVYVFLGAEKYFFGYRLVLWQGMGIILHLLVLWLLLQFLLLIERSWAAFALTAFFAFQFSNMEMVTWQHIHAYMLFLVFLLMAFRMFQQALMAPQPRYFWFLGGWLLAASLTHELGNAAALLFAVVLGKRAYRREAWLLVAVPLLYLSLSLLNGLWHPFVQSVPAPLQRPFYQMELDAYYALGVWSFAGWFPFELQWLFAARNMIAPEQQHLITALHLAYPASAMALGAGIIYGVCLGQQSHRTLPSYNKKVSAVACGLMLIFAAVIAFGRGGQWNMAQVLRINTYYFYMFWLLLVILMYSLVNWQDARRWLRISFMALLVLLAVWNGRQLYAACDRQAKDNNDIAVLVRTLNLLIDEHARKPGFSFFVAPDYPGNYVYEELRRKGDVHHRRYTFAEALYAPYWHPYPAKFNLLTHPRKK